MTDEREQRNAVFNAQAATPVLSPEIPVEIAPLPSNGKVYPIGTSLHNVDRIEISAMTTKQEDILTSRALIKKGTVISELIRSCLLDKAIDPTSLLVGDRNAIMISIRANGYGSDYEAKVVCGNAECALENEQVFDLSSLPIKRLVLEPVKHGVNEFPFTLPHSKREVVFRFLTGRDEEEVLAAAEQKRKLKIAVDENVSTKLLLSLVSVDGDSSRGKVAAVVRTMVAKDSRALRAYITKNEPGIDMVQTVKCESCHHVEEVSIPLGTNFFWPDN